VTRETKEKDVMREERESCVMIETKEKEVMREEKKR
jgi:hypothetical protein